MAETPSTAAAAVFFWRARPFQRRSSNFRGDFDVVGGGRHIKAIGRPFSAGGRRIFPTVVVFVSPDAGFQATWPVRAGACQVQKGAPGGRPCVTLSANSS
jgi:hypothetical protein